MEINNVYKFNLIIQLRGIFLLKENNTKMLISFLKRDKIHGPLTFYVTLSFVGFHHMNFSFFLCNYYTLYAQTDGQTDRSQHPIISILTWFLCNKIWWNNLYINVHFFFFNFFLLLLLIWFCFLHFLCFNNWSDDNWPNWTFCIVKLAKERNVNNNTNKNKNRPNIFIDWCRPNGQQSKSNKTQPKLINRPKEPTTQTTTDKKTKHNNNMPRNEMLIRTNGKEKTTTKKEI